MDEVHRVSPEVAEEVARGAREARVRAREQVADVHRRLGERQHATENVMHRVADSLPDPELVHRRATQLSQRAEEHLDKAERERATIDADKSGPEPG